MTILIINDTQMTGSLKSNCESTKATVIFSMAKKKQNITDKETKEIFAFGKDYVGVCFIFLFIVQRRTNALS